MTTDPRRRRVVEALAEVIVNEGWSAATVAALGRRAGVSRATIYRWFPGGRDEIVDALVRAEIDGLLAVVDQALSGEDLGPGLVAALQRGAQALAGHRVLNVMLDSEPEELAEALDRAAGRFADGVETQLLAALGRHRARGGPAGPETSGPQTSGDRVQARYLRRMLVSHLTNAGSWDLTDRHQVEELVEREYLASVRAATSW